MTTQAVKRRLIATEAPKPPATVQPPKRAPGMYKGKIVQSKVRSLLKSSASVDRADPKFSTPSRETHMVGKITKSGCGSKNPAPTVSQSLLSRPAQVSICGVTSRPLAGSSTACPPISTAPSTQTSTSSRNPTVAAAKSSGTLHSEPKIQKVSKPPVSSSLSQYRLTMETAEERRAKLAEWLASRGKTFKRPAMTTAELPAARFQPRSHAEPHSAARCTPVPDPSLERCEPQFAAADCAQTQRAAIMPCNPTPDRVDDIVVSFCDALEAMATPSRGSDQGSQASDVHDGVESDDCKPKGECPKGEMKNKAEESDKHVMESMTEMGNTFVIKYIVKTTPHLQSLKMMMKNEATSITSTRKNITDIKFLTPVRRSRRIHRKSSHLPVMLLDHDPCVSSLAELLKLDDDDGNAYIYRKNPTLLEDLPYQSSL